MSEILETNDSKPSKNKHGLALLAGIGVGLVMGAIVAAISIALETEIGVWIGLIAVAFVVSRFAPNQSGMGAITGALSAAAMLFTYALVLISKGYWYEDGDSAFWITLAVGVIFSGIWGYKGKKTFSGEE